MSEQWTKNDIWKNLENPTHHHTEQQILSLKKFASSPPQQEIWKMFLEWSKRRPEVYDDDWKSLG